MVTSPYPVTETICLLQAQPFVEEGVITLMSWRPRERVVLPMGSPSVLMTNPHGHSSDSKPAAMQGIPDFAANRAALSATRNRARLQYPTFAALPAPIQLATHMEQEHEQEEVDAQAMVITNVLTDQDRALAQAFIADCNIAGDWVDVYEHADGMLHKAQAFLSTAENAIAQCSHVLVAAII